MENPILKTMYTYVIFCKKNMKEQESIETPADILSEDENKKLPLEKKRKIRKEKVQLHVIDYSDVRNIDTKKLTRE